MIVCYAMGNSISIVVDQQLGAGEIQKAKDYDLKMLFMNFCDVFGYRYCIIQCFITHT